MIVLHFCLLCCRCDPVLEKIILKNRSGYQCSIPYRIHLKGLSHEMDFAFDDMYG
jgi:hypothetical protein